ncbi:MAG TPA: hypothetical protein VKW76_03010 [Candidatus Binatia bacterium]|nr:hypothetical protein [Candidatus Binatia bacterium]
MRVTTPAILWALALLASPCTSGAVTITFERLGLFGPNQILSWQVTDENPDLVEFDCSSGTCVGGCAGNWTICEVQGFRLGETVIVSATSPDCYACPPSHPAPGQSCGSSSSSCPGQPAEASACMDGIRFDTFTVGGKGEFKTSNDTCQMTYPVQSDVVVGACWQCGPVYILISP